MVVCSIEDTNVGFVQFSNFLFSWVVNIFAVSFAERLGNFDFYLRMAIQVVAFVFVKKKRQD